jgi:hypothetical protein
MSVTTSYPGIYIQELPSNTHTIAAAPTSVTVFVGYIHPFQPTPSNFGKALEIFSFSDYERLFGGFYQSGVIDANVSYAVNEFFDAAGHKVLPAAAGSGSGRLPDPGPTDPARPTANPADANAERLSRLLQLGSAACRRGLGRAELLPDRRGCNQSAGPDCAT